MVCSTSDMGIVGYTDGWRGIWEFPTFWGTDSEPLLGSLGNKGPWERGWNGCSLLGFLGNKGPWKRGGFLGSKGPRKRRVKEEMDGGGRKKKRKSKPDCS